MKLTTSLFIIFNFCLVQGQIFFENQASARGVGDSCGSIALGMGISFNDYNNDGWDDITFATQGSENVKIYKNTQNGFFILETQLNPFNLSQQKQPIWVDFDNDGDKDLFVTSNTDGNRLYRNDITALTDITVSAGLPLENLVTYGASWGDYNNEGFLDVFISNRDDGVIPNFLFKNNGNGTFTNVSNLVGISNESRLSFGAAFFDYNNDGWQDIYVINDRVEYQNQLYSNNGDGTFNEVGETSGTNIAIEAMSTTIGDFNNDGWFEIYITNGVEGNAFLKNNADGTFTDVAEATGTVFNSVGWGAVFLDAENDLDLDLYVSGSLNGSDPSHISAAFYENLSNGTYSQLNNGSFSGDTSESYANAIGDIDNDGYPEIIVGNSNNEDIFLWKNLSDQTNNWLKVNLQGTISNKQGVGSVIEISTNGQKQYRYTLCGEGFLAQNSDSEFFGLGNTLTVDYVKVKWLSGIEDIIYNVSANQSLTIIENSTLSTGLGKAKNYIEIYPIPTSKTIKIKSESIITKIRVYDTMGKALLDTSPYALNHEINIENFLKGVYILKVQLKDIEVTRKIIKD